MVTPRQNSTHIDIIAFGDCNTSSIEQYGDMNLCKRLVSELLNHRHIATLNNTGQGMYTSREGLNHSKLVTKPYDIALINFGLVDAWVTSFPKIYIPYFPSTKFQKFKRKILKSFKKRIRHPLIKKLIPLGHVVSLEEYRKNIKSIIKNLRDTSPDIKIILWGTPPTRDDENRNNHHILYNNILDDLSSSDPNIFYIDTTSLFHDFGDTDKLYYDSVHINEVGQNIIVKDIIKNLELS